jgi:hypothetical protein
MMPAVIVSWSPAASVEGNSGHSSGVVAAPSPNRHNERPRRKGFKIEPGWVGWHSPATQGHLVDIQSIGHPDDRSPALPSLAANFEHHPNRTLTQLIRIFLRGGCGSILSKNRILHRTKRGSSGVGTPDALGASATDLEFGSLEPVCRGPRMAE